MDEKSKGERTLEGAIEHLAQRADQLKSLESQAGNLLLILLRREKSPDPPPQEGKEPATKPTMIDILYLISEGMDLSIVRTSNILAETRSMIS